MAQKMGTKLAKDKIAREGIVEPANDHDFNAHENRKFAAMGMHATSKPPYDSAPAFLEACAPKVSCPTLIAVGEVS